MFQLPAFQHAYLFQKPISMRWGEKKLTQLCQDDIGVEPHVGNAFMFFNSRRDCLKLFFYDAAGSNELQKWVPRGGFVLPAPIAGQSFAKIAPTLIKKLFGRS